MKTHFVTVYGDHLNVVESDFTEDLAQQQFKEECDINAILKRFQDTGMAPHDIRGPGQYGDFSDVADYQSALNAVQNAQEAFDSLPSSLRARFQHDPAQLLGFLQDDSNRPEAIALGLIEKPPVEAPVASEPPLASKKQSQSNASD